MAAGNSTELAFGGGEGQEAVASESAVSVIAHRFRDVLLGSGPTNDRLTSMS
jgi:hypothetical protein